MKREVLRAAIDNALTNLGEFSTGWVLVYESVDSEGGIVLCHEISDSMADWTRTGMLYAALDMGPYLYDEAGEE
jgi:hypothetical protein